MSTKIAPWQANRAQSLLEQDITLNISVPAVATACHLSPAHFNRGFKRATGYSMHEWVIRKRIEKAKTLLKVPSISLVEVALVCGFSDQPHFTRQFHKRVGVTPAIWRRENKLIPQTTLTTGDIHAI